MSIAEYHFYHGAAMSLIAARGEFTGLTRISSLGTCAYAVNHDTAIYLKHTTNSNSPWYFTFLPEHQEAVRKLFQRYEDKALIALVCGDVGVCLLTYGEYAAALDENFKEAEALTVERPGGGGFRVRGAAGKVKGVVPLSRFPQSLFQENR